MTALVRAKTSRRFALAAVGALAALVVIACGTDYYEIPVSYTHLTLPTNREV